ncbi:PAS domain S-box protein [Rhabdochromatium marinum]|uniref:PAS domain S-box protein n=1 Tax=Rhabdochromatium marinum TaxID=48729 RepID=UPI001903C310|nr:PAS domain S-box protein [Rhabdochromatium marinum]
MNTIPSLPPTMARDVLGSIKDGVIALTPNGRILMINPVAESLLGVTAQGAVGQTFADTFLSYDGLDAFNDCMLEAIYTPGTPQTIELTLKPSGVEKFVTVRTNLLVSSDDGQIEGVVAVIADISERVLRLRDRLEQEQLRSAAGRFIVAVLAIFSVFTLLLEPIQKFALAGGTDVGPLVGLAALMLTAFGIKRWIKLRSSSGCSTMVANLVTTLPFAALHAHLSPVVAAMVIVPSILRDGTVTD